MQVNKYLRMFCYTVALVISLLIALNLFSSLFFGTRLGEWMYETLRQRFDHEAMKTLLERGCIAIGLIIAGFLYFAIFFLSGFSQWLKNFLLQNFPDPEE